MKQILSMEESIKIRDKIWEELDKYKIIKNGYWFPLCKITNEIKSISFLSNELKNENWLIIYNLIKSMNIKKLYFMQEVSDYRCSILDLDECLLEKEENEYDFPYYSESYCFDEEHRIFIYVSHEDTVSFTGKEIVEKISQNKNLQMLIRDIYYQKS